MQRPLLEQELGHAPAGEDVPPWSSRQSHERPRQLAGAAERQRPALLLASGDDRVARADPDPGDSTGCAVWNACQSRYDWTCRLSYSRRITSYAFVAMRRSHFGLPASATSSAGA